MLAMRPTHALTSTSTLLLTLYCPHHLPGSDTQRWIHDARYS